MTLNSKIFVLVISLAVALFAFLLPYGKKPSSKTVKISPPQTIQMGDYKPPIQINPPSEGDAVMRQKLMQLMYKNETPKANP